MKRCLCRFPCRWWPRHDVGPVPRFMAFILCCYCTVLVVMAIYGRTLPIRNMDDKNIKRSSSRDFSCHSHCNETQDQITTNTSVRNQNKVFIKTSKSNKQNGGNTRNNTNSQDLKNQLIDKNTSRTSQKNQSALVIKVYRSIKTNWTFNTTAAEEFRVRLEKECKTSEMFLTTQDSVKINESLQYEAERRSLLNITPEIHNRFPKELPYRKNSFKKCSIVANSGIIVGSKCGESIDSSDFVVRFNMADVHKFSEDTGSKTNFITCNPSILVNRYSGLVGRKAKKFREEMVASYHNATVFISAFTHRFCTKFAFRAQDALKSTDMDVVFSHPSHMTLAKTFWKRRGVKGLHLSSGLLLFTAILHFCQEVHLYAFWPFLEDPTGNPIQYHYFDPPTRVHKTSKFQGAYHNMPSELTWLIKLHNQGIIKLHVDPCA
ncbi:alpha-2,8-sialyltransferase 8E-like [Ptychodera flava]|uniref:alpha-2,8-sialyltransferase 8E-like n=1 Tax=Ptychodera flava TaxID=63121 RepID=UPI00396AA770